MAAAASLSRFLAVRQSRSGDESSFIGTLVGVLPSRTGLTTVEAAAGRYGEERRGRKLREAARPRAFVTYALEPRLCNGDRMTEIEEVSAAGRLLVLIVRQKFQPDQTNFVTDDSLPMQVGFIVYPEGGEVGRHVHVPLERSLVGTSEVLIVRSGRCEMDVYDDERDACRNARARRR